MRFAPRCPTACVRVSQHHAHRPTRQRAFKRERRGAAAYFCRRSRSTCTRRLATSRSSCATRSARFRLKLRNRQLRPQNCLCLRPNDRGLWHSRQNWLRSTLGCIDKGIITPLAAQQIALRTCSHGDVKCSRVPAIFFLTQPRDTKLARARNGPCLTAGRLRWVRNGAQEC
jgi:hypothetical protein